MSEQRVAEPMASAEHWGISYDRNTFCTDHDCWCHRVPRPPKVPTASKHKWDKEKFGSSKCRVCGAHKDTMNGTTVYRAKDGEWRYSYVPCRV